MLSPSVSYSSTSQSGTDVCKSGRHVLIGGWSTGIVLLDDSFGGEAGILGGHWCYCCICLYLDSRMVNVGGKPTVEDS